MNAPETHSKSEPVIHQKDRKSLSSRKFPVRLIVQIFFFGLIGLIAVNHSLSESGVGIPFLSNASLHAICPFGGVETTYQLLSLGTYVQKVHAGSVVLMAIVFFLAILFGPVFCGWVCPLGSFQEWVGKLGRKLLGHRFGRIIPARLDRVLRWFRLPFLVWVVYVTARSGTLLFANLDPYHALFNFWTSEVAPVSLIVLGVTAALSLVVALYKNLPADLDGTYLPTPAVQLILNANPSLSAEQKDYLASHQIELVPAAASSSASTPNEANTTPVTTVQSDTAQVTAATEPLVNGTATFQQVLDAGITQTQIEQVLGAPMPPTNQSVRDYCTSKGISFSTVKNALNALVPEK